MTNNFRTIALALRDHISDTYALLAAADAVERIIPDLVGVAPESQTRHDVLVDLALRDPETMQHMRDQKKINAIKSLRLIGQAGLKEAKEAVEDVRVVTATGYSVTLYQSYHAHSVWEDLPDEDEPPF